MINSDVRMADINIRDIFCILVFHEGLTDLDAFQQFCKLHEIPEQERVDGFETALRGLQEEHLYNLEIFGPDILGINASPEYESSISIVERSKRPQKKPFDVLARFAFESFRSLQCRTIEDIFSNAKGIFQDYILNLDSFFSNNVKIKKGDLKIKLRIQSVELIADILINPGYGVLRDHCSPMAAKGRKNFIMKIWRGYFSAVGFLFSKIFTSILGDSITSKILKIGNLDDALQLYNEIRVITKELFEKNFVPSESYYIISERKDTSSLLELVKQSSFPDNRGEIEKMDELFNHKPATLFDGRSKVYAGPAMLIRLILGEVEVNKKYRENGDSVRIIRFIHPNPDHSGNRFSYAILIQYGWLVFYWVCNDYSGGSKSILMQIEDVITINKSRIEVVDAPPMPIEELKAYVVGTKIEDIKKYDPKDEKTEEEALPFLFDNASLMAERIAGLFLEYLVVMLLSRSGLLVDWAFRDNELKDVEIDIIAYSDSCCWIVECSHRLSSDKDETQKLVNRFDIRERAIPKIEKFKSKEVKKLYVTRSKYVEESNMEETLELLTSNNIAIRFIEECLSKSLLHKKDRDKIEFIINELDTWRPKETGFSSGSFIRDLVIFYQFKKFMD